MLKYRIHTIWKSLTGEKNTLKAFTKLILTAIGCVSSVFTFAVLIKDWVGFDKFESLCKKYWIALILIGFIASLIINHEKISCHGSKEDDDLIIDVKINSLFKIAASSYVIPTNTYFRTIMKDEYISPNSVQGAFQNKYYKKTLDELDSKIAQSLADQGIVGVASRDNYGDVKKYPIGTVAKVTHKKKHYYFVAICDVNEFGKPIRQNYGNVTDALNGLITTINRCGHCDDLAMPLIGTGRAAIREATIDKVVQDTIDFFLDSNDKIAKKLVICISPKDYSDGRVNIKKIANYLEFKCEFDK